VAAAFTDHLAVLLRIDMDAPYIHIGKGVWRMKTSYLNVQPFRDKIKGSWEEWKTHMKHYPETVHWLERYVIRMIKQLFTCEGTERNSDRIKTKNFYNAAIYNVLLGPNNQTSKAFALRRLKVKIVCLNSVHLQRLLVDTNEQDRLMGEEFFLHNLFKTQKTTKIATDTPDI